MARVFDVPRYRNQAIYSLRSLGGINHKEFSQPARDLFGVKEDNTLLVSSVGVDLPSVTGEFGEYMLDDDSRLHDHAYAQGIHMKPETAMALSSAAACVCNKVAERATTVWSDDEAARRLCFLVWTGKMVPDAGVRTAHYTAWVQADNIARAIFINGMVGDKINTVGPRSAAYRLAGFTKTARMYPKLAAAFTTADAWRMGMDDGTARAHLRAIINDAEAPDADLLRSRRGQWAKTFTRSSCYRIGALCVVLHGNEAFVLDKSMCDEIHLCIRYPFAAAVYCAMYRSQDPGQEHAALDTFASCHNYLVASLDARYKAGSPTDTLAKQMKASYAVLLAQVGSKAMADEGFDQRSGVAALADEICQGERPFYETLCSLPEDTAIDIGTYWNALCAPDADAPVMDQRLQETLNAPKEFSASEWSRFMAYSRTVITAHIIRAQKEVPDARHWELGGIYSDPEDIEWATRCAEGDLDYPPERDWGRVYIHGVFDWSKKMESWAFAAKDVTHVFADLAKYQTVRTVSSLTRSDNSELAYALTRGPFLSDNITVDAVRKGMEDGKLPGDRVLVVAAKRENTKDATKTRETWSADDVLRESLSELDMNANKVGRTLHGVAMRMGRLAMEKRTARMRAGVENGVTYISLDVSGWSPNMSRENEMEFHDMLMSFYDIPDTMRVSSWFRDIKVVHSRRGFHSIWDMIDGSVQGFFGTCDTILHNMMCQYAVRKARADRVLPEDTRVDFLTLIDDVAKKILSGDVKVIPVLESITNTYRLLGFDTDLVKTLASNTHWHLLNRLFRGEGEVVTACKIFSKADREWERRLTGVWSKVDSCMGAVLGAADRGACVSAAYFWALVLASKVLVEYWPKIGNQGLLLSSFGAWLPRVLGGIGLPGVVEWVTQESVDRVSAGISTIQRIARLIGKVRPSVAQAIHDALQCAIGQKIKPRSASAAITAPFGLAIVGVNDPESAGASLLRKGAARLVKSPDFKALLNTSHHSGYDAALGVLARECRLPAAIWERFAASLPHSVIDKILIRAERNEVVIMATSIRERHAAINKIKSDSRIAVRHWASLSAPLKRYNTEAVPGSRIVASLREQQAAADGINAFDFDLTPALECLAFQGPGDDGSIVVSVPSRKAREVYDGNKNWNMVRTYKSSSATVDGDAVVRSFDPVVGSSTHLAIAVGACHAMGGTGEALSAAYCALWFGDQKSVSVPRFQLHADDPRRVAMTLTNTTHSVMALPNFIGCVTVNANRAMLALDAVRKSFDWLSVVTAARAVVAIDQVMGASQGGTLKDTGPIAYSFDHSGISGLNRSLETIIDTVTPELEQALSTAPRALSAAAAARVIAALGDVWSAIDAVPPSDFELIPGDVLAHVPPAQIFTNPFDLLRRMQHFDFGSIPTAHPLAGIGTDDLVDDNEFKGVADVAQPRPSVQTRRWHTAMSATASPLEARVVQAFREFAAVAINGHADDVMMVDAAAQHLRTRLSGLGGWAEICSRWGVPHYVKLIHSPSSLSNKHLLEMIVNEMGHPPTKGLMTRGSERVTALMAYASEYQAKNTGGHAPHDYASRFSAIICRHLARMELTDQPAHYQIIEVSEALLNDVAKITRRAVSVNPTSITGPQSAGWVDHPGAWAEGMVTAVEAMLPPTWRTRRAILEGLRRALFKAQDWVIADVLVPQAIAHQATAMSGGSAASSLPEVEIAQAPAAAPVVEVKFDPSVVPDDILEDFFYQTFGYYAGQTADELEADEIDMLEEFYHNLESTGGKADVV